MLERGCEWQCAPASVTPDLDGDVRLLVADQSEEIRRLVQAQRGDSVREDGAREQESEILES